MKKDKTSAKFGFCKPNLVNVVWGGGGGGGRSFVLGGASSLKN